jgi:hypothetical protein
MAGAGKKTFTAGEILTASDTNTYLMEQTVMNFAGTAARASAIPTPTTGMTTYNQTTQQLESYNGSAFIGMSGLQLIKKQTIGSGVSSVTVTGAFSATYENYKIVMCGVTASATHTTTLQLGSTTTLYYDALVYNSLGAGGVTIISNNGTNPWRYVGGGSTNGTYLSCDLYDPFASRATKCNSVYMDITGGGSIGTWQGFQNSTTSFTAFTLTPATGTWTGGTIYVYGYGV